MDNKKFITYMEYGLAALMAISLIYFIAKDFNKKVENYPIATDSYYTGNIVNNKLEGKATLKTSDGIYKGSFKNSRFDGPGIFMNDDFIYTANFDHKSGNSNVEIKLNNGDRYKKTKHGFTKVDKDEN